MIPLEQLNETTKGRYPGLLGVRFTEVTESVVRAELEIRKEVSTVGGTIHGGALMGFADTVGAVATVLHLPPNAATTTLESKTNFFRPIPIGEKAIATCTALHRGKRTHVLQTRIETEAGKLAAIVTQTQMVLEG